MTHIRKKSTIVFAICSFITSLLFVSASKYVPFFNIDILPYIKDSRPLFYWWLVFSNAFKVAIPLVTSAIILAGSLGFIFGNSFSSVRCKSKNKAMLLGGGIIAISFAFSLLTSIIALESRTNGFISVMQDINKYLPEIVFGIGINGAVAAPVLLLLGAVIGIYVKDA